MSPIKQVVAGRSIETLSRREECVALLRNVADQIETGAEPCDEVFVAIRDTSDVDTSYTNYAWRGRSYTDLLGLIEFMKFRILNEDMLPLGGD